MYASHGSRLTRASLRTVPPAFRWATPGKASDFIRPLRITPGMRVILCLRVSFITQHKKGNLKDQEKKLRKLVESRGGIVVAVVKEVGSGWNMFWLIGAAELAKKHKAILLAESTCRFVRHEGYHSVNWPNAQANLVDLERLRMYTDGVTLMTATDPDAPFKEVKSEQTKRGMKAKDKLGGRPVKKVPGYKKELRLLNMEKVRAASKLGMSVAQICREFNVARRTFYNWEKLHKTECAIYCNGLGDQC